MCWGMWSFIERYSELTLCLFYNLVSLQIKYSFEMTNFTGRWLVSDAEMKSKLHISFLWRVEIIIVT